MTSPTIPAAVASGGAAEAGRDDEIRAVRPVATGVVAGVIAAVWLLVVFLVRPVPVRAVELVGGPSTPIERQGGLHVVWADAAGARHERDIAGVGAADAADVAAQLTGDGLQFREVLQVREMQQLATLLALPMKQATPVDLEIDTWSPVDGGTRQTDYYLLGTSREALDAAFARARAAGWTLPGGAVIAYQPLDDGRWRSYVLSSEVAIDGTHIANAAGAYDPNTTRPIVLLDFDREGAQMFGDVTARVRGRKLAIVLGGVVKSAPVINDAIRGGRASIAMGAGDAAKQERERDVLVATLRAGILPRGSKVVEATYRAPVDAPVARWLARAVLSLGVGALVALLVWALVHATRPVWRRRRRVTAAGIAWSRLAVTLLAPAVVLGVTYVPLPFVDYAGWGELRGGSLRALINAGSIGVTPILTAYLVVALVAAIVPPLRRRRFAGDAARRPFAHAVALLAIALVAVQAWFIVAYLQSMGDFVPRDATTRLALIGVFEAVTAAFAIVAAVIRRHGLGNGYGALLAAGWAIQWVRAVADGGGLFLVEIVATLAVAALLVAVVLRWRIVAAGETPVRLPASGVAGLAQIAALAWLLALLVFVPYVDAFALSRAGRTLEHHLWVAITATLVAGVVWSLVFARPGARHRYGWRSFWRATLVSCALLLALGAVLPGGMSTYTAAAAVGWAAAIAWVIDALADLRRGALVRAWTLHDAQQADVVERALADAGIASHLAGANLRAVLAGFGPFAPIDVLVARDQAEAAFEIIRREIAAPALAP